MENYYSFSGNQQDSSCGGCDAGCFGGGKVKKDHGHNHNTDSLLASELNELSVKERERVNEEVHGVAPITAETPELLQEAFAKLDDALPKNSRKKRRAWERAMFLKPSLAKDRKFHLMFLRADQYDAVKAARRMCNYFTNKLELFGHEKLVKKITLDDLNDDDLAAVKTGSVHMLPEKDSAGRMVWFIAQRYFKYKHWKNQVRYLWYQLMAVLENEDAQLNGLVNVMYCVDMESAEQSFTQMISHAGPLCIDLPFRIAGLHYCYNNIRLRPAISLMQMIVGKQARLRFRIHYGSNLEAQYALVTFGIPMGSTPIRSDGGLKKEVNERYLAERRYKEAEWQMEEESCTTILYPSPKDVLLGRGRPYQEFGGNKTLAHSIAFHRARYQQGDRFDKTCISLDLVTAIQEKGGRFLQRIPEQGWEEIGLTAAREKVSHAFRAKPTRQTKPLDIPSNDDAATSNNKRVRYDEDFLRRHETED